MKKIILLAFVLFAGCSLLADALYWQVGSISGLSSYDTKYKARVAVVTDGVTSYANLYANSGSSYVTTIAYTAGEKGAMSYAMWADLGSYSTSASQFYVEILNYSTGATVGKSETLALNTVTDYISSGIGIPNNIAQAYAAQVAASSSGGGSAPEPTSGLLLMIGACLLGLRRRKV